MYFTFTLNRDGAEKKWFVAIPNFNCFGSHFQVRIESHSGIRVIFGKLEKKYFVCIPEMSVGCELLNLWDEESNSQILEELIGEVDGISVAKSLSIMQKYYGL
jgi:hypothetical protein